MPANGSFSRPELNDRIAILRDNIRQLTEQAAAMSGAADEARNADRLAQQQDELDALIKQRDALPVQQPPARKAKKKKATAKNRKKPAKKKKKAKRAKKMKKTKKKKL